MSLLKKFYRCPTCNKFFHTKKALLYHKKKSHECLICPICNKEENGKNEMNEHLSQIHFNNQLICPKCKLTFSKSSNLNRHFYLIHCSPEKISCTKCHVQFKRKQDFKVHEAKCSQENPPLFTCEVCKKSFSKQSNLRRHKLHACHEEKEGKEKLPSGGHNEKADPEKTNKRGKTFECNKCAKKIKGAIQFDTHKKICSALAIAPLSHNGPSSCATLKRHLLDENNLTPPRKMKKSFVTCLTCGQKLEDYKDLYKHKMMVIILFFRY